ncbi:divergent PAP2 family protein [Geomicrobium sediminis]|uniref:Acid phosphatase family membrane protein YuiD n=1 Tax=Geomicrobium sediminis TaxID=1347788 RepID=A0ABS2P9H9_9BACL|nr:divergent PAP2 family protein [Geomicrobium sediminis]MBM7631967.1 acid phosphatase family membrane protein YuiD [Geomicrobium sediminis]
MEIIYNYPLWMAISAIIVAQLVKVPIAFIATRKVDFSLITSTGGMPSSHSAAVTALATTIGLEYGFNSTFFALSAMFAIIVMYDATGVRRHAGYHATMLNQLMNDFNKFMHEAKNWQHKEEVEKREELKELLGHKPIEVFFGALLGILLAIFVYNFLEPTLF